MPDLSFEVLHFEQGRICVGVDEVGRGCLAGPVVTAAVVLPQSFLREAKLPDWCLQLNDSKLLNQTLRERLSQEILKHAQVQIAWCLSEEIDQWNILHAAMIAMRKAVSPFSGCAQTVLVDGNMNPFNSKFRCPENEAKRLGFSHIELLVKGDQRSYSIAAASIVAKVYRDKWMAELDTYFPGYCFAEHKGYSTRTHQKALTELGPCKIHRMSFAPVRKAASLKMASGPSLCKATENGKQFSLFDTPGSSS